MTVTYLFIVLGIAAGAALLAARWLWAQRRRRQVGDEHRIRQRRLDRLDQLVNDGERDAHFAPEIAAHLRHFVDKLRAEAR